jgi:hypothetical protein
MFRFVVGQLRQGADRAAVVQAARVEVERALDQLESGIG